MIFKPVLLMRILCGEKWQTRRPADPNFPCRWEVGKRYRIQPGMARSSVAEIEIDSVRLDIVGNIDEADAVAEGFNERDEFKAYWSTLYHKFEPMAKVWVITFHITDIISWPCTCCEGEGYEQITDNDFRYELIKGAQPPQQKARIH